MQDSNHGLLRCEALSILIQLDVLSPDTLGEGRGKV